MTSHNAVNFPTLFIEINSVGKITYIGKIYKPPSADCNVFKDSIQNFLSSISQSKIYDLMLCCDLNIDDLLNKDSNNSTLFPNTMYSLSPLLPIILISKPTRITDNLQFYFFINEQCKFNSSILIPDISERLDL